MIDKQLMRLYIVGMDWLCGGGGGSVVQLAMVTMMIVGNMVAIVGNMITMRQDLGLAVIVMQQYVNQPACLMLMGVLGMN